MAGIMAGTVAGLLIVRRKASGKKNRSRTVTIKTRPLSVGNRYHVVAKPSKTRGNRQKVSSRLSHARLMPAAFIPQATTAAPIIAVVAPSFSSCPACGLEAPEVLMEEHFVQSPSHKAGPVPSLPPVVRVPASSTLSPEFGEGEEQKLSFRNLLQLLVPPRAFGHRHQQRTVNPLSRMVQAIEVPSPRSSQ